MAYHRLMNRHSLRDLHVALALALALAFALTLAGCGAGALTPDPGASLDGAVADSTITQPDAFGDNARCEAELAATWKAAPPVVGLGSAMSIASYQGVIGKLMSDFQVPGGAVAVTRNGKLVMAIGIGLAEVENLQPAHPDQLFRLASLSKQITSAAVLRLAATGKLDLDEPAFPILADLTPLPGKSVNPALAKVTVRQLLQHTGGWNRDFERVGDPMFASFAISSALGKPGPASCEDTIRYMLDKAPTSAPGSTYCYSNFGYCVLGRILERRAQTGYEAYVRSNWLRPAGATRTQLGKTLLGDRADDEVRYYGYPGEPLANSIFPSMPGQVPWEYGGWAIEAMDAHGGWISSVVDLLHSQLAADGLPDPADLVDANQLAAMLANPAVPSCTAQGTATPADPAYWYGFGWSVNKYGNHWHSGALSGTATFDATLANGYSWAAFFNSRPADGAFYGRLDGDLWNAWDPVHKQNGFSSEDWFNQFPAEGFSPWMDARSFNAEIGRRRAQGQYAMRLEGRSTAGVENRAEWAPLPPTKSVDYTVDMDCVAYRGKDAAARAQGLRAVSVQSFVDGSGRKRFQASWAK